MSYSDHEKKVITITEASVDTLMIPLIQWMNKQPGITTLFCCQDLDDRGMSQVIFLAYTLDSLQRLIYSLRDIGLEGRPDIRTAPCEGLIRFELKFDKNQLSKLQLP